MQNMTPEKAKREMAQFAAYAKAGIPLTTYEQNYLKALKVWLANR